MGKAALSTAKLLLKVDWLSSRFGAFRLQTASVSCIILYYIVSVSKL